MKKTVVTIIFTLFVTAGMLPAAGNVHAEDSFVKVPVGISYSSTYWWRGVELNGKGVGVIWPSAGLELGDTGLSLSVAAGINEDYLVVNETGEPDVAESYHEFDYGMGYSMSAGILSVDIGVMYVHYPFYDEGAPDATDPSFVEGSLGLGLDVLLSPTVEVYYDYYMEETDEGTPQDEDYYVRLSFGHDVISSDAFTFSVGTWGGYYNNAYLDVKGFSDAGVSLGTSSMYGNVEFTAAVYYARSLDKDFQDAYDLDDDGRTSALRNHVWAEFGVSTTL